MGPMGTGPVPAERVAAAACETPRGFSRFLNVPGAEPPLKDLPLVGWKRKGYLKGKEVWRGSMVVTKDSPPAMVVLAAARGAAAKLKVAVHAFLYVAGSEEKSRLERRYVAYCPETFHAFCNRKVC